MHVCCSFDLFSTLNLLTSINTIVIAYKDLDKHVTRLL